MAREKCCGRMRILKRVTNGLRAAAFRYCFRFPAELAGPRYQFDGRTIRCSRAMRLAMRFTGLFTTGRGEWWITVASRVVGEFQASVDDPAILDHWPADFRIRVSYEVRGRELVSDIRYENTGTGPLPCGFGTHAYFRLPLSEARPCSRNDCYRSR